MCTVTENADQQRFGGRRRDALELAVTYGLILGGCWMAQPLQRLLFWIGIAWVAAILLARRDDWENLGFGLRSSLRLLWVVGAALFLAAAAIAVAGAAHSLHGVSLSSSAGRPLWPRAGGYIVWSILQQIVLQDVVLLRLLRLVRSERWAVGIAAVLFASAHLPNPVLVPMTLLWGTMACLLFVRYRGVFSLGVAHAILGLAVALTVPNAVDHHMRVGRGYWTYHADRAGHRRGGIQE
jgi:membrane protease YdiL (CAAX protease family)